MTKPKVDRKPRYAGYSELSEAIHIPVGTIYGWVRRGFIPHLRLGPRLIRFDLDEVSDWLKSRQVKATTK